MKRRFGKGRSAFVRCFVAGESILDIGCAGPGASGFVMHKVIVESNKSSLVIGLDTNLAKLKERLSLNRNLVLATGEYLPFGSATFDCVYMGAIIEHLWCGRELLRESHRVLKENGTLCLDTPNVYSLERIMKFIIAGKDDLAQADHKVFYSPASLSRLLNDTGFEVSTVTSDAKIISRWGQTIYLNSPPFRWLGSHLCIAAKKRL